MKYCKHKSLNESATKAASLRLINDIAVVDVDLAAKLRPSIVKFVESLDVSTPINKNDMLAKLTEFFKIQSTTDKAEWLKQHQDIADTVKTLMDSTNISEEGEDEPGLDTAPTDEPGLDTAPTDEPGLVSTTEAPILGGDPAAQPGVLEKMQLDTKIRGYIESQLTEFLANSVNASVVAMKVPGYDTKFAATTYNDSIATAFDRVMDVLVSMLLDNY